MGIDTNFVYFMGIFFQLNKELDHKMWKNKQIILNKQIYKNIRKQMEFIVTLN